MRSGIVTNEQAENYRQFKEKLKALCANASSLSSFYNATVEELEERHGYGFALRHALCNCVSTKYVCVVQHDRTFMRHTPINAVVETMWNHPNIKYVGMSMRSNLTYRDIFLSKYGCSEYAQEFESMVRRPSELLLDSSKYGPNSESSRAIVKDRSEKLRNNLVSLAETYTHSSQSIEHTAWLRNNPIAPGRHQLTLTPTLFWYDNTHIAETVHYREFIFHPSYKMVAKGGFVEEGVLPVLKKSLDRLGLREGFSRFGCYLLDDHSGYFFTGHLDGGAYVAEAFRNDLHNERNRQI
jgi:hypothetical protein